MDNTPRKRHYDLHQAIDLNALDRVALDLMTASADEGVVLAAVKAARAVLGVLVAANTKYVTGEKSDG